MIAFKMLAPPSANKLFRNVTGIGRVKTREYRTYIRNAGLLLNAQIGNKDCSLKRFTVPVEIRIALPKGNRKDVSNCIKAIEDTLVKCAIIPNDSPKWVKRCEVMHAAAPEGPDCIVTITPWEGE